MRNMRTVFLAAFVCISTATWSQHRERFISFAVTNQHSAYPFSVFAGLFTTNYHPGVEAGYTFNWKTAPRHNWYQSLKAGYYYHRFVQHAIPLYTQLGYRYKLQQWRFSAAFGAGYLHSIPDAAVLKMDENGNYQNAKGLGRGQALLNFTIGTQYLVNPNSTRPVGLFLEYQQQLQTPFINSYVPLLPYNSVALGCSLPLKLLK